MRARTLPKVRHPALDFGADIPRDWFGGNVVATHIANGVNLLFPAGERFFVRSVRHYLSSIDDETLRAQIDRFFKQEGRHAREHDRVAQLLAAQGYDVERFLAFYEKVAYRLIEAMCSPELRLATTAACEHFTALLAEEALEVRFLDRAHPTMRALLLWHAVEEIEHRSVAFDVLSRVAPSYRLRVLGLGMASACLAGFWVLGTLHLLAQDRRVGAHRLWRDFLATRERRQESVFVKGIRAYLRPEFHPTDMDLDRLAARYIEEAGLEPPDALPA